MARVFVHRSGKTTHGNRRRPRARIGVGIDDRVLVFDRAGIDPFEPFDQGQPSTRSWTTIEGVLVNIVTVSPRLDLMARTKRELAEKDKKRKRKK